MKKTIISLSIAAMLIMAIGACKKQTPTPATTRALSGCTNPNALNYDSTATVDSGCVTVGHLLFYANSTDILGTSGITVVLRTTPPQIAIISQAYPGGVGIPASGAGCANFYLPVGAYGWTASSNYINGIWDDTIGEGFPLDTIAKGKFYVLQMLQN